MLALLVPDDGVDRLWFLHDYVPQNRNPSQPVESRQILELKRCSPEAIGHYVTVLDSLVRDGVTVVTVPSSTVDKTETGINLVARRLARVSGRRRRDGTSLLERTETLPAAHLGGRRDYTDHLRSISLGDPDGVKGRDILLLDDVATTQSSLRACTELLSGAGARSVTTLALACTVSDYPDRRNWRMRSRLLQFQPLAISGSGNREQTPFATLTVDHAGHGDHLTIGGAIRAAVEPGTLITVKPGTYREEVLINKNVKIIGEGGRSKVIVEGAPGANVFDFLSGSATLTGLTIRIVGNGQANRGWNAIAVRGGTPVIEDCDLTSSAGSAVYIVGAGANPVIRNCTMRNSRDSGVAVYDQGQGTIDQCVISGNAYPGVTIKTGGNPAVRDCEIRDGQGPGVYVYEQGQGTFERCVIAGNAKVGVAIKTGGNPTVRDCEIRDGKSFGVSVHDQGQGTFERCVIAGNASRGVAIRTGGNPTVRDCEIRDSTFDGVLVSDQGQGTIEQCVISGNAYAGVQISKGGNPTVRDCKVRGGVFEILVHPDGLGTISGCDLTGATTRDI